MHYRLPPGLFQMHPLDASIVALQQILGTLDPQILEKRQRRLAEHFLATALQRCAIARPGSAFSSFDPTRHQTLRDGALTMRCLAFDEHTKPVA